MATKSGGKKNPKNSSSSLWKDFLETPPREFLIIGNYRTMRYKISELIIEMWNIMFAAPSYYLPTRGIERILLTACLLANLILMGTFQGSLTTSFSTVTYYKDINTLEELDATGLPIFVGSRFVSGSVCAPGD